MHVAADSKLFLVRNSDDTHNIDSIILRQLQERGYTVTLGHESERAQADVIVDYWSRWAWDITPYLLELSVEFRDAKTGLLVAAGES